MGQLASWSYPTRILFGAGAAAETGNEVKRLGGKRALIVTDKGVIGAGLVAPVEQALASAGLDMTVFADVESNPVEKNVHDGVLAYREAKADIIVAVGGGSPLDVGKIIRLKARPGVHERPLVEYDDATGGDAFITSDMPPMLALPTTAGTGSEVGRSGVVTLDANRRKTVIFCLEAYVSTGDHPMADAIALGGLRLVAEHLERAVTVPTDIAARGGMMKAAMMGAVAFQKGLGACHSLAHPLSNLYGLHHGLANALCLPAVVDYNAPVVEGKLSDVARALGGEPSSRGLGVRLRELRRSIGLPESLAGAGVKPDQLEPLADGAIADACHRSNPRPCTRTDLLELYRASL
jgi:alcohol dehydrogenase class IV